MNNIYCNNEYQTATKTFAEGKAFIARKAQELERAGLKVTRLDDGRRIVACANPQNPFADRFEWRVSL